MRSTTSPSGPRRSRTCTRAPLTTPGDERRAYEAMANVWSAYGYQDAPIEVLRMLVNATEIGYMATLNDVRKGDLDDEIVMWRPDLAEQ
jgi:hypothetical protein